MTKEQNLGAKKFLISAFLTAIFFPIFFFLMRSLWGKSPFIHPTTVLNVLSELYEISLVTLRFKD